MKEKFMNKSKNKQINLGEFRSGTEFRIWKDKAIKLQSLFDIQPEMPYWKSS